MAVRVFKPNQVKIIYIFSAFSSSRMSILRQAHLIEWIEIGGPKTKFQPLCPKLHDPREST